LVKKTRPIFTLLSAFLLVGSFMPAFASDRPGKKFEKVPRTGFAKPSLVGTRTPIHHGDRPFIWGTPTVGVTPTQKVPLSSPVLQGPKRNAPRMMKATPVLLKNTGEKKQ
jgi:hypothetical protein